jgi:hypothetical protein
MTFYGKYEDDSPSLAQQIAREMSKRSDDDDVRLTARYCNSGGDDEGGTDSIKETKVSTETSLTVDFDNAKVGDVIKGLEKLGPIVYISGPETTPEKVEDRFSAKKMQKIGKWLLKKGFEFDGAYKGQLSYWMEEKTLSVVIDPNMIIINLDRCEDSDILTDWKSAKDQIKMILSF